MSRVHVHATCYMLPGLAAPPHLRWPSAHRPLKSVAPPHPTHRHPHTASHRAPRAFHICSSSSERRTGVTRSGLALPLPRPPTPTPMNIIELETKTVHELRDLARDLGPGRLQCAQEAGFDLPAAPGPGGAPGQYLRRRRARHRRGWLRLPAPGALLPGPADVYVSQSQIRRFGLRTGDRSPATSARPRRPRSTSACCAWRPSMARIPEAAKRRPALRQSDADLPARHVHPGDRCRRTHPAADRPGLADRQGPARADRLAAQGGQDD